METRLASLSPLPKAWYCIGTILIYIVLTPYNLHYILGLIFKAIYSLIFILTLITIITTLLPLPRYKLYILRPITFHAEFLKGLLYTLLPNNTSKYL